MRGDEVRGESDERCPQIARKSRSEELIAGSPKSGGIFRRGQRVLPLEPASLTNL